MLDELHPETVRYVLSVGQEYRKKLGQFFTPKSLREELIGRLPRLSKPRVLDPACGTGEFLLTARDYFEEPELYCWEIDPALADIAKRVVPEAFIEVVDSLKKPFVEYFDVVLGNPPYLEVKLDRDVKAKYSEVVSGRANLYSLFIYLGLRMLKPGGWLAYVVSSSMNNGAYFKKLREYILRVADIEYMKTISGSRVFREANHTFQLLVLRKRLPNHKPAEKFVFERGGRVVFSEHAEELKKSWVGSLSLAELNYRVRTGRIVWNQCKDKLTDDPRGSVLLIWSHNIGVGELVLGNRANKPQYIRGVKVRDRGPAIVTNRVVGHPSNPRLRAAIVPEGLEFVAENHVNVVYPPRGVEMTELSEIVEQLNSERVSRYISMLIGNTQVSARELEHLIPIVPTETMRKRLGERQVV
ncbi:MAG: N-6 DNA methylase [Sulfolobales archaeon]